MKIAEKWELCFNKARQEWYLYNYDSCILYELTLSQVILLRLTGHVRGIL